MCVCVLVVLDSYESNIAFIVVVVNCVLVRKMRITACLDMHPVRLS